VAAAESGRNGEVRQFGVFENRPEMLCKMAAGLGKGGRRLSFCYEAGPCGYGLHRLLTGCGHSCIVVALKLMPFATRRPEKPRGRAGGGGSRSGGLICYERTRSLRAARAH